MTIRFGDRGICRRRCQLKNERDHQEHKPQPSQALPNLDTIFFDLHASAIYPFNVKCK
jgi:hypothetical protein